MLLDLFNWDSDDIKGRSDLFLTYLLPDLRKPSSDLESVAPL